MTLDASITSTIIQQLYSIEDMSSDSNSLWRVIASLPDDNLDDLALHMNTACGNQIDMNLTSIVLGDPYFSECDEVVNHAKICVHRKLLKTLPLLRNALSKAEEHIPEPSSIADMSEEDQLEFALRLSMEGQDYSADELAEQNNDNGKSVRYVLPIS